MGGIHLDVARSAGDLDANDYTDIRISRVVWDLVGNSIVATYQMGLFDDVTGEWTPGILGSDQHIIVDGRDLVGEPDPSITDYTDVFEETFKQGGDTNCERFLEMLTNVISLRRNLPGVAVKPGKSGKKKV